MNIKQNLTTTNYRANGNTSRIKYIVVHYTAGKSDYEGKILQNGACSPCCAFFNFIYFGC